MQMTDKFVHGQNVERENVSGEEQGGRENKIQ